MNTLYKYRSIIWTVILVLIIAVLGLQLSSLSLEDILRYRPESLPLAALVLLSVYCFKALVMVIPVVVLYISAGVIFPLGWAIFITYLCLACEVSIGYALGKRLGQHKVKDLMNNHEKLQRFFDLYGHNQLTACFLARLIPLPIDMVSLFFGAAGHSFPRFLLLSLLGVTPHMIPYVCAGQAIMHPWSKEFLVPFGLCLVLAVVLFVFSEQLMKRRKKATG